MRARVIVAVALAALGITACIIGPKQDDPASLIQVDPAADGAVDTSAADTADRSTDSSPASVTEGGLGPDAATDAPLETADGDARADGDAASDAAEGG